MVAWRNNPKLTWWCHYYTMCISIGCLGGGAMVSLTVSLPCLSRRALMISLSHCLSLLNRATAVMIPHTWFLGENEGGRVWEERELLWYNHENAELPFMSTPSLLCFSLCPPSLITLPFSLTLCLSPSLSASLPHSLPLPPSLILCLSPSLSASASLPHSLPLSSYTFSPSLSASASLSASLPHSLPLSLTLCLRPSLSPTVLPHSLPLAVDSRRSSSLLQKQKRLELLLVLSLLIPVTLL